MEGDGRLAIAMGSSEYISNLPLFENPILQKYRVKCRAKSVENLWRETNSVPLLNLGRDRDR